MCTAVTIHADNGSFFMVFNRDELDSRAQGEPPTKTHLPNGVTMMAPRDPDAGGTWIAVTTRGEAFALLNNYQAAAAFRPSEPVLSRGAVIGWLAGRADGESVSDVFGGRRQILDSVRPFRLLFHGPDGGESWDWSGERLQRNSIERASVAISSGTHQKAALRDRGAALAEVVGHGSSAWSDVADVMSRHQPAGPSAVCMHRQGGQTVSQTAVEVTSKRVAMHYKAGAPCTIEGWQTTEADRTNNSPSRAGL